MKTNFLVIGSGISGLNFALNAAKKGKVTMVTKKNMIDSATNFAQGGIAAVLDKTDKIENHIKDTLEAGAYHNDKKAVRFMVENGAEAIYRLIELGVEFEKEKGHLKLTREGGHHQKRIAYVGDYTGQEIEKILVRRVKEHPNITILENAFALDLIIKNKTCYGALVIKNNRIKEIFANQVVLATGGLGQIFGKTTNPPISTGDGVAMSLNHGLETRDMEFIQFHPTALDKNISPHFLISETVRGEGAKLLNAKGERFMEKVHPLKELAPRDIVAREIYKQQKIGKVYLDIRHHNAEFLKNRFPQIYLQLKKYGLDMAKDLIPVTPVAHYCCGGVITNLNGETGIKNLFAFGEVAATGVHGANRLASNSLLEALVFSNQVSKKLQPKDIKEFKIKKPRFSPLNSQDSNLALQLRKEIQKIMWEYCGIVRNTKQIHDTAIPKLKKLILELSKIKSTNRIIAETINMGRVGLEILSESYKRKKSLGCHYLE